MENTEFNQRLLEIGNGVFVGSMFVYEKTHCNRIFKVSVNYTTEKFEVADDIFTDIYDILDALKEW